MNIYLFLKSSGMWGYPLLFLSVLSLTVVMERIIIITALKIRNTRPSPADFLTVMKAGGDIRKIPCDGFFHDIITEAFSGFDTLSVENIRQKTEEVWSMVVKRMAILDYVVTVAPLVGILGTITGIIKSFYAVGEFNMAKKALLTGGISEALLTTAAGLIISVFTLTASSLIRWSVQRFFEPYEKIITLFEKHC